MPSSQALPLGPSTMALATVLLSFTGKGLLYHGNCDRFRGKACHLGLGGINVQVSQDGHSLRPFCCLVFFWRSVSSQWSASWHF